MSEMKIEKVLTYMSRMKRELIETVKTKSKKESRKAIGLEVEGLDPQNPKTWLTPGDMLTAYKVLLQNGFCPTTALIWSASMRGSAEALVLPPRVPLEKGHEFLFGKLYMIHTEYSYGKRRRMIFAIGFVHKDRKDLRISLHCNGIITFDKDPEKVTEDEHNLVWKIAEKIEEEIRKYRRGEIDVPTRI